MIQESLSARTSRAGNARSQPAWVRLLPKLVGALAILVVILLAGFYLFVTNLDNTRTSQVKISLANLNGDHDLDAVFHTWTHVEFWQNDGRGQLSAQPSASTCRCALSSKWGT